MSWEDILKEKSVKELVKNALELHGETHDFYKETYTKKDIKQIIDFFKKKNKRDGLMEFELDYNNEAIKLLRQALRKLQ
tara:strand:+ start:443 stop:679 length:237 start_codon:yes stop_codon:yes gene_type:complete